MNFATRFFKEMYNSRAIHAQHAEFMREAGYVYTEADVVTGDKWGNVRGVQTFSEGVVLRGVKNWFNLNLIKKTDVLPMSAIADAELRNDLYERAVKKVLVAQ